MSAPLLSINPGVTINAGVTLNGWSQGPVTLTSGTSLGFDGTGHFVQVTGTPSDWSLVDNWCIEWWEKLPDAAPSAYRGVIGQMVTSNDGLDIWHNNGFINVNNAQLQFYQPTPGTWHHIAVQKDGATVTAYIDGMSQILISNIPGSSTFTNISNNLIIGDRTFDGTSPISQNFVGQLANIRISKIHRYSATFTPPTTVVTDSNTVLALDSSVGSSGMLVDASPSNHTIVNNGAVLTTII
jgi:hypothetical protein